MGTKLILVRHAKTAFNIHGPRGRFCGCSDPGLNEAGRRQVERLIPAIAAREPDRVYSSPLRRALQTAGPIARSVGLPLLVDRRLREVDYGVWDGLSKGEVERDFLPAWQAFQSDPVRNTPPGSEPLGSVQERAESVLGHLLPGTSILVAHKTFLRVLLCLIRGESLNTYRSLDLRLASISVIDLGMSEAKPVINDTSHLYEGSHTDKEG